MRQTYQSTSENFQITDTEDYDRIVVNVSKVDQPYKHLKIVEFEFGSSVTLGRSTVTGSVTLVSEKDRTGTSMPMNELTFSVINAGWIYDFDSPSEMANSVAIGKPLMLSYSVQTSDGRKTVQSGRYIIRAIDLKETIADVTAYDPRVLFQDINTEWSIPTTTSIGDAMDTLCEDLGISHQCSDDMYSLYPPRDLMFDSETSYMDDLIQIFQLLGLEAIPGSDGILRIGYIATPQTYGTVGLGQMFTYPQKKTESNPYNFVEVHYGTGTDAVSMDLRTDPTVAISQLTVRNDLVMTQAEAQAILNRLVSAINTAEIEVRWTGDPALEVGDLVGFPGRWSDAVARYVSYQEISFENGMQATTRCLM